jgi:hypothetical protein
VPQLLLVHLFNTAHSEWEWQNFIWEFDLELFRTLGEQCRPGGRRMMASRVNADARRHFPSFRMRDVCDHVINKQRVNNP